jgi:GGDEF domain-containing protein
MTILETISGDFEPHKSTIVETPAEIKDTRRRIPLTVMGIENTPCGQLCVPFAEYCHLNNSLDAPIESNVVTPTTKALESLKKVMGYIASEDAVNLAQGFCTNAERMKLYRDEIEAIKSTVLFWELVANNLSTNNETGLIEGRALTLLIDKLYESGTIQSYAERGYRMQLVYADLDDLKKHNENVDGNGHEDGDKAIVTFGKKFRECFGRNTDISMLLVDQGEIGDAEQDIDDIISRSNHKGDEYVSICFVKNENHRDAPTADDTRMRLESALNGLSYESNGLERFVTATFAVIDIEIPPTKDGFYDIHLIVDLECTKFKTSRKAHRALDGDKLRTAGIVVDIS